MLFYYDYTGKWEEGKIVVAVGVTAGFVLNLLVLMFINIFFE